MNGPSQQSPPDSCPPIKCFAHCHMTATEYAIWSVCRAMATAQNGIVYFSGPKIAAKFREMSKNTPYHAANSLQQMGWLKKIKDSHTRSDGTYTPRHFRVLSHEEWTAEHPYACETPSRVAKDEPSKNEGTVSAPSKPEGNPSQPQGKPSQPQGTNLYIHSTSTDASSSVSLSPSQREGMALQDRFGPRQRGQRKSANAAILTAQPFPQVGMGVSDTRPDLGAALMSALAISDKSAASAWRAAAEKLTVRGHDPETILAVANFYIGTYGPDTVNRQRAAGFEIGFGQLLRAMTDKQLAGMRATTAQQNERESSDTSEQN